MIKKNDKRECNLAVEPQYGRDNFCAALKVDTKTPEEANSGKKAVFEITPSFVLGANNLSIGGSLVYAHGKEDVKWTLGFQGKREETTLTLTSEKFEGVTASLFQNILPRVDVGVIVSSKFSDWSRTFKAGFDHKFEDGARLRMMGNVESKKSSLATLYSTPLNSYAKLSLSSDVSLNSVEGAHKWGLKFEIGDVN